VSTRAFGAPRVSRLVEKVSACSFNVWLIWRLASLDLSRPMTQFATWSLASRCKILRVCTHFGFPTLRKLRTVASTQPQLLGNVILRWYADVPAPGHPCRSMLASLRKQTRSRYLRNVYDSMFFVRAGGTVTQSCRRGAASEPSLYRFPARQATAAQARKEVCFVEIIGFPRNV
jgi:hypothetical protein